MKDPTNIIVRIYSITKFEYDYLQALAAFKTLDFGTIFDTESGIPSNIKGGAGVFCIESLTERTNITPF